MYGTQDASAIWQKTYTSVLLIKGFEQGKAYPATFYHPELDATVFVHGDDFNILADEETLDYIENLLKEHFDLKVVGTLGPDARDDKELVMLNRVLRYEMTAAGPRMEIEADSRHSELVVKELNLTGAKGVDTPSIKKKYEIALAESPVAGIGRRNG